MIIDELMKDMTSRGIAINRKFKRATVPILKRKEQLFKVSKKKGRPIGYNERDNFNK